MPVTSGPERALLESLLEENRASLVECVQGLSEADARRRLVPSLTTPLGLLKHMAAVERSWFQRRLAGLPEAERDPYAIGDEPSWALDDGDTVASVVADLERAMARSREIEEIARHAGHADILREQIDGKQAT